MIEMNNVYICQTCRDYSKLFNDKKFTNKTQCKCFLNSDRQKHIARHNKMIKDWVIKK